MIFLTIQYITMESSYSSFEDALGYFYDCGVDFTEAEFWKAIATVLKISDEQVIPSLHTSQSFIFRVFKFLTGLPYKKTSRKILKVATQFLDPSPQIFKRITQELVPCLENQIPCLSTLNVCLSFYNSVFQQQSPINENLDSHVYLYGQEEGIVVNQQIKWPFEKGGTLALWYCMHEKTKQCKLFQFLNEEKMGFEIVMRNKKIYIQKEEDESKFRLIKNTSSFLCDAIFNRNVKLCVEFEIRKKFFQPYLSINLIMNNFVVNGVEIDSFPTNASLFQMKLFKGYYGKFYSCLVMADKLASQYRVDELNNLKGFIYESDIRNFTYLLDNTSDKVLLLFSAIRSNSQTECPSSEPNLEPEIEDELKQSVYAVTQPVKTDLYDAIGSYSAHIGRKAYCYHNTSIGKEIGNYGGFEMFLPLTNLLQVCCCEDDLYSTAVDQFLEFIRLIFENKADSIERACQVHFFKQLALFFQKTKMQGFTYQTITRLKEVYISLNTRMLREKFIEEVIWGVNFGLHLSEENFSNYIKLIKTFYNEDIQSSLHTFDITKIIYYIQEKLDSPECCCQHVGSSASVCRVKNYPRVLLSFLEVVENIILIKRSEPDLDVIIKKIMQVFGLSISPCFIEALISFIKALFEKDELIQRKFLDFLLKNTDCKFYLYKSLSSCSSWKVKGKVIEFILKMLQANFFEDEKKQREMLTLCARYPTMNFLRSSSIKSKSQENRDSLDYSEDKLSLNSATMHKLIVINPIEANNELLLDDFQTLEIIFNWAFSDTVGKLTAEDHENPGLLILMQLYKGTTYRLREQMSGIIKQKMKSVRFSPELMAWAIECSLIAEYDMSQSKQFQSEIETTKENLIELISKYSFLDMEEEQNNELSIIKLVFSSVKSKYPDDIVKVVGNKLFFIICDKKMQIFAQQLKDHDHVDINDYDRLCTKIISNVVTFMNEYYVIRGDGDENEFDEDMAEIMEKDNCITLEIMEKILQIFVLVSTVNDRKIIEEANAQRNHFVITILLPEKEKEKEKINIMFLIFGALQNIFEFFEDLEIEPKKKCLILIKKYMIYIIELTENSAGAKLESLEEDLKNMFLLNLSFIEQKYHQYFYYPYERHKNIDFQVENKIRKSIEQIKRTIYNMFLDLIELIQYIDEKGDLEHKSFYELMKPKRKPVHKYALKHLYPTLWKKTDEKIKEFFCLKRDVLRKQAQQKLESHLLLKKISQACVSIEKTTAKKIFVFVEAERKQSDLRQKKSVNFYKISESEKCRSFCECEEELLQNRLRILQQEKNYLSKQKETKSLSNRELRQILRKIWNENRTFGGFWTNKDFYLFSQNEPMRADNTLHKYYQRVRSRRQSKYFLMPFIKIQALEIGRSQLNEEPLYANQSFMHGVATSKNRKRMMETASDKFINGLQFIKKKVYSKLVKTIAVKQEDNSRYGEGKKIFYAENVLWVRPMKVNAGSLKIEEGKISYCLKPGKSYEHISLLKNQLLQSEMLIKQWKVTDIEGLAYKRFLLKQNSIQINFKTRKSVFFCFYGISAEAYANLTSQLSQLCNVASPSPDNVLISGDSIKGWQTAQYTEKWLNYQMSNLEYLMCLNAASGRTCCDLNQYPVMPWVFSQYSETKFKKNEDKYRDFSKNTAQLGREERIKKFQEIYESLSSNAIDQFPVAHHFGFHYSNLGIILQYLIRVKPYTLGARTLQGDKFDIPDRLFYSVPESFKCAINEMSDLRELTPQFFYFPQFLINSQGYDFGCLQEDNKKVNHVELPDGCLNAYDFIEHHREGLESKEVSINLHKWIDLIFGYKNSGKEAEKHLNTYHYLSNEANSDRIDQVEDLQERQAMESQMAYYGKTPSQIFSRPHPQRQARANQDLDLWEKTAFSISQNFNKLFKAQSQAVSSTQCFSYCDKTKTYLLLSKNGKGLVFSIDRKQIIKVNQFSICYQNVEGINVVDKSTNRRPFQNIEGTSLAIGGLWGGKLLIINIMNASHDILLKHTGTISALKYSAVYCALFSGSSNGQLCKWSYRDKKVGFSQKIYCHSGINAIEVDADLKVVGACTEDGCLWLFSLEKMELIRILKVQYAIESFAILKYPFYSVFIACRGCHQYCFSINGAQIEEAEMESASELNVFEEDCCRQKMLVRIGADLVFLKTPQLQIEEKLQVGIGNHGFLSLSHYGEIVVLNDAQLLVWKRPLEESSEFRKSLS